MSTDPAQDQLVELSQRAGPQRPGAFDAATAIRQLLRDAGRDDAVATLIIVLDRALVQVDDLELQEVGRAAFRLPPYRERLLEDRLDKCALVLAQRQRETTGRDVKAASLQTMRRRRTELIELLPSLLREAAQSEQTQPQSSGQAPKLIERPSENDAVDQEAVAERQQSSTLIGQSESSQASRNMRQSKNEGLVNHMKGTIGPNMESLAMEPEAIGTLPISQALSPAGIRFGEKSEVFVQDLLSLKGLQLHAAERFVEPLAETSLVLADVCPPDVLAELRTDPRRWFPHGIQLICGESAVRVHRGHALGLFVATDVVYPQESRPPGSVDPLTAELDSSGIAPFVHTDGRYKSDIPFVIGSPDNRLGSLAAAFVVAFDDQQPVARSHYVALVRRGIRYPDDVWWSAETGKPLANSPELATALIAFQSRRSNRPGTDIYVCGMDGSHLRNVTHKDGVQSSRVRAADGSEVFRWLNETTFQCGENARGVDSLRKYSLNSVLEQT